VTATSTTPFLTKQRGQINSPQQLFTTCKELSGRYSYHSFFRTKHMCMKFISSVGDPGRHWCHSCDKMDPYISWL